MENNNIDYGPVYQFSEGDLPSKNSEDFIKSLFQLPNENDFYSTGNLKITRANTSNATFPYTWGSILAIRSRDSCGYLQWGSSGWTSLYCGGGSASSLWSDKVVLAKELQSSLYCASDSLIQSIFTN